MTDESFTIGPGIAEAMYNAGDEPRSSEIYEVSGAGHSISKAYGRDAVYYWYEEDNRTQRLPFR